MLEPDKTIFSGLKVPGKDRVVFRPKEKRSLIGMKLQTTETCISIMFNI